MAPLLRTAVMPFMKLLLYSALANVCAEDRLDPEGGTVMNDGEFVRFDKDGKNVNLGDFDSDEVRVPLFHLNDKVVSDSVNFAESLLFPEEFADACEIMSYDGPVDHFLSNLYAAIDIGLDENGEPTGLAGDSEIDRSELSNRIYGIIRAWQGLDDEAWTRNLDSNNDALVSLDEFNEWLRKSGTRGVAALTSLERFKAADKNADGWLSESDVARYRNPLWEGGRMNKWATNAYLLEMDRDQNGLISFEEYVADGTGTFCNETRVPVDGRKHEFSELDVDKSGDIDMTEISMLPKARVTTLVSMVVNSVFTLLDTDGDSFVSPEEFSKAPIELDINCSRTGRNDEEEDLVEAHSGGTEEGSHDEL